jgi:hypothetical protein
LKEAHNVFPTTNRFCPCSNTSYLCHGSLFCYAESVCRLWPRISRHKKSCGVKIRSNYRQTAAEIAAFHFQEKEQRKFEDDIPKHVPIKFRLKPEKEKKFKDLDNPSWYRDFELEVTNTSDKPIYFLLLWLVYPEIQTRPGVPLAVPLQYGRMNFIEQETRPISTDVPIQPGETYVFTIPERDRKGWEAHKKSDNVPDPKKALLTFVHLSFGDGTGFATSGAKPYAHQLRHTQESVSIITGCILFPTTAGRPGITPTTNLMPAASTSTD